MPKFASALWQATQGVAARRAAGRRTAARSTGTIGPRGATGLGRAGASSLRVTLQAGNTGRIETVSRRRNTAGSRSRGPRAGLRAARLRPRVEAADGQQCRCQNDRLDEFHHHLPGCPDDLQNSTIQRWFLDCRSDFIPPGVIHSYEGCWAAEQCRRNREASSLFVASQARHQHQAIRARHQAAVGLRQFFRAAQSVRCGIHEVVGDLGVVRTEHQTIHTNDLP